MDNRNEHLNTLSEIRSLMERSSRFISLSGLSVIFAGIFALAGVFAAYMYLHLRIGSTDYYRYAMNEKGMVNEGFYSFFFIDAISVLFISVFVGLILTIRKANQSGQAIWDATAKRLLINLIIPLIIGGIYCLVLLFHGLPGLVAPVTLIFYGLSLLNASKYTLDDIRYLGFSEIILGLIASFYIGYGLLFWALGFGIFHIIYGTFMYFKYEK